MCGLQVMGKLIQNRSVSKVTMCYVTVPTRANQKEVIVLSYSLEKSKNRVAPNKVGTRGD